MHGIFNMVLSQETSLLKLRNYVVEKIELLKHYPGKLQQNRDNEIVTRNQRPNLVIFLYQCEQLQLTLNHTHPSKLITGTFMQAHDNIKQNGTGQRSMSSYDDRNKGPHRALLEDPKVPRRQRAKMKKEAVLIWMLLKGTCHSSPIT